ncbi:hypothetical protein FALCPG4_010238 [Fusarium falciforme]
MAAPPLVTKPRQVTKGISRLASLTDTVTDLPAFTIILMGWWTAGLSHRTPLVPFPFLSADPVDAPECWLSNAELIFHYTNVTCRSILSGHAVTTYQVVIPREGLSHPYLMRMIMALSSFHLAYLNKDKRPHYLALANKQQSLAIRGLRGTLGQAVTRQNCHALWVSSIFLAISKSAFSPNCEHH